MYEVCPPQTGICGCGLNLSVHERIKAISNVKIHLMTRSGNVNMNASDTVNIIKFRDSSSGYTNKYHHYIQQLRCEKQERINRGLCN